MYSHPFKKHAQRSTLIHFFYNADDKPMMWNQGAMPTIGSMAVQFANRRLGPRCMPSFGIKTRQNYCRNARASHFGTAWMTIRRKCSHNCVIIIPTVSMLQQKQLQGLICGSGYLAGAKIFQLLGLFVQVLLKLLYRVRIILIMIGKLLFSYRIDMEKVKFFTY